MHTQLLQQKLRAENKLQSYLSAQQCKGPLFALTKLKISDSRSKPAQKVLKALFATVKGPHTMHARTRTRTRHSSEPLVGWVGLRWVGGRLRLYRTQ
jgi:hypothetical protein